MAFFGSLSCLANKYACLVLAQIIIIIFIIIITGVQEFCYSARAVLYFAHKIKRCRINE